MMSASESIKGPLLAMGIMAILALGLVGLVVFFNGQVAAEETRIQDIKDEYGQMLEMRKRIEDLKRKFPKPPPANESADDIRTFLTSKARQAGLPMNQFSLTRNQDQKTGGWKEVSYTVTLSSASKDNPLTRGPVVDFLRLVEEERPSIKSKNLSLNFVAENFQNVVIQFSYFQRES